MACFARLFAPVALGFLAVVAAPGPRASAAQVTLAETGSTLIYPVFRVWAAEYPKSHPGVAVTAAATGSGAGVEQAISGAAQIGASDAYMSDTQVRDNPLIINVPMAISAQTVNYNIPGLNGQTSQARRPNACGHLLGQGAVVGRPGDRGNQYGCEAAPQSDRSDPPKRRLGRHVHLHPVSDVHHPVVGVQPRVRHNDRLGSPRRTPQPPTATRA